MDSNAAHHVIDAASPLLAGFKGHTIATGTVTETKSLSGVKMFNANLNIDYWLRHTRYDALEKEHTWGVEGGGDKTKGFLRKVGYGIGLRTNGLVESKTSLQRAGYNPLSTVLYRTQR